MIGEVTKIWADGKGRTRETVVHKTSQQFSFEVAEETEMSKGQWMGDLNDECQICHLSFGDTMYDAAIGPGGPWGNICRACFVEQGCSLGMGRGQEYVRQRDGRWAKVAG